MIRMRELLWVVLSVTCTLAEVYGQSVPQREFISFEAARPVLSAMRDSLPADLKPLDGLDAAEWSNWLRKTDREIRDRLDRGEEDTLTNLLRFGVTFTKEFRIDDDYLVRYGESSLVKSFAENRANDLIRVLAMPGTNEGMARMRAFLKQRGYSFTTPAERTLLKKYLLDNLARMRDEVLRYHTQPKGETNSHLFEERGISLDTNLWPDFLLDQHFRNMVAQGALKPGSVRRIAIVGPGLDFANKEKGNDFYPPQTIQPFAVLDSLIRLGVADSATVELYTIDISSDVNFHVARAQKNATLGRSYAVQLPWNTSARRTDEYRANFVGYWQKLGGSIGKSVTPILVPKGASETQTRAVRIRPEIVRKLTPVDMNIVFERLQVTPQQAFDLIIGTNIFIYYGPFEQSLARSNVAAMLKPGGYLLSNDKLPSTVPSGLEDCPGTNIVIARDPDMTDSMFCYKRVK